MTTLHIISRAPSDKACWHDCLKSCSDGDSLLLIENAVYGATSRPPQLHEGVEYLALQADLNARGLNTLLCTDSAATVIDDNTFVERCVQHKRSISWF